MPRILIVDDSPFEANQMSVILEKMDFEVVWAENGIKGMSQARQMNPDLILLDLVLPDINGYEVCRWLRKQEETRCTPIIMVTAKERTEDKILGLGEGANDYITKPFEPQELKARVDAALRIKRLQDELVRKNEDYEILLQQVQKMAVTDSMTGLFNRRYFQEALEKEFLHAKRYGNPLSCLMMDVDYFKLINDTYGHDVGDKILKELGEMIKSQIREVDVLARFGGDELILLLPKSTCGEGLMVAQRIAEDVGNHVFPDLGKTHRVTISIGVAGLPDPGLHEAHQAILTSDFALYKAKRAGRNRVESGVSKDLDSSSR